MSAWLESNLNTIVSISSLVIALCGALTAVIGVVKMLKTGKISITELGKLKQDVNLTQQGIVEAFKSVRFPTEWRVDLSKKNIETIREEFNKLYKKLISLDEAKTKLMIYQAKILSKTAAYNKLTDDEKAELNTLLEVVNNLEIID